MDIADLLVALGVKCRKLLTSGGIDGFLKVRAQAGPSSAGFLGDTIAGIDAFGAVAGLVLAVEVGKSGGEAVGDTMLVVECNGTLDGIVADGVPVRQIFGNDARTWLVFLSDVMLVAICLITS